MLWTWKHKDVGPQFISLISVLICYPRFWEQVIISFIRLVKISNQNKDLCSLRSKIDRLSFSCIWEITPEAEVIDVRYTKSVIRSKASLTYDEAQARLDDPKMIDSISNGIRVLNSLAKKLRAKRIDRGALTLASPEVRFKLENDSQDPVDVGMRLLCT